MAGSLMNKVWDFFGMEVEDDDGIIKKITGIVAVADNNKKENVLLAFNTDGKYSQIITEQFFKDVK